MITDTTGISHCLVEKYLANLQKPLTINDFPSNIISSQLAE